MALSSGFTAISADGRHSLGGTTSGFNSENEEEEIDQLDSGLDEEESDGMEPEVEEDESASSAAKGRRKLGARTPGHTLIPQDRLDNMLQAEGAGPHMSKEAIYMLSIATEEFVKKLAEAGYQQTVSEHRQHVQYRDMANVAHKRSEFKFLDDTIPKPISIVDAMQRRAAKERELLEDDPAISAAAAPSSPPFYPIQPGSISIGPSASASSKAKAKTRQSLAAAQQTNGQQTNGSASASAATPTQSAVHAHAHAHANANAHANASAHTSASASTGRGSRQRDRRGRWSNAPSANGSHEGTPSSTAGTETRAGSARIRNRSTRAREAADAAQSHGRGSHSHASSVNGTSCVSASASVPNGHSASTAHESISTGGQQQVIGPASGFMEDGNRLVNGNPGRTIYSQQRPPAQP